MDIRNFFFKNRSYTPIPLALAIIYFSRPALPYLWIGILILFLGEFIRFNGVRYAGGVTRTTKVGAPSLCTSGPFAYVRNPLYLGNMLMYTGIVLIAGAPNLWVMLMVTWAFFIVQYSLIVSLEEETLTDLFGAEYETYKQHVPALFPRLTRWENNDDRQPKSIRKTLNTERRTMQNVLLIVIFLIIRAQFPLA